MGVYPFIDCTFFVYALILIWTFRPGLAIDENEAHSYHGRRYMSSLTYSNSLNLHRLRIVFPDKPLSPWRRA